MTGDVMQKVSVKARFTRVAAVGAAVCASLAVVGVGTASASSAPAIKLKSLGVPGVAHNFLPISEVTSPNGKLLYVAGDGGVRVINLAKPKATPKKITDKTTALTEAAGLAISPSGKTLYIVSETTSGATTTYGVDIADVGGSGKTNNTVIGAIKDPKGYLTSSTDLEIDGSAIAPNGKTLYVSAINESSTSAEGASGLVMATLSGKSGTFNKLYKSKAGLDLSFGLAISPKGNRLYVPNIVGPAVALTVSGEKISSSHLLPEVLSSGGFAVSPDGRTLYSSVVSFAFFEGDFGGSRSEVQTFALSANGDGATLEQATLISGGKNTIGLDVAPSGKFGYAAPFKETEDTKTDTDTTSALLDSFAIPAAATRVTIGGKAKVGLTLGAKIKGASGASASYQWFSNGHAIKGAKKKTLTLSSALKGKKISVKATVSAPGYHAVTLSKAGGSKVSG